MPIQLEIFHPDRIIVIVARGNVTLEEYGVLLGDVVKAGGVHYRKILDATSAESEEVTKDVLLKADELTRNLKGRPRGPLALVVDRSRGDLARTFKSLSTDRPVEVFGSIHDARTWLRSLPIID